MELSKASLCGLTLSIPAGLLCHLGLEGSSKNRFSSAATESFLQMYQTSLAVKKYFLLKAAHLVSHVEKYENVTPLGQSVTGWMK